MADVAEAILGAACISGGRDAALRAAKALTIPFTEIEEWSDLARRDCIPLASKSQHLDTSTITAVENIIGHTIQKTHLLALALVSLRNFNVAY